MKTKWDQLFAERTRNIFGSQIRQYFALTEKPEVISFAGGFPGNEFFPTADIAAALSGLVQEDGQQALQYSSTEGSLELRSLLAEKMCRENAPCSPENIIITGGSQQGIDLLGRILINPDDPVLVEEPSYIGGTSAFRSHGGIPAGIAMDHNGPVPAAMEKTIKLLIAEGKHPKLFYTVANFQNPTGITTSYERRLRIMEIASRYNIIIIEDNPYGELCYEGEIPPSYKSLDLEDRVVYLGSFSKVLVPGIRIGWMAGPGPLVEKAILTKQSTDLCSSSLGQQLACRLIREGFVEIHTRKLIDLYRRKRDAMVKAMDRYFPPDIEFNRPRGGFFVWVKFPPSYPISRELLTLALQHNVAFVHGEGFSNSGDGGTRRARFSFSQPPLEHIEKGIKTLGKLFWEIGTDQTLKAT
ncbi:MAG TPA: PLP-dependent aminotransferase family protein [Firmicutes bacterium]|nr:PLP-dependent aminotransferase family protein [Bacillota bacterium]